MWKSNHVMKHNILKCFHLTFKIALRENEDILLLDNSNSSRWKVRNGKGEEAKVPAVSVLIPGPDKSVIELAVRYVII